MCSCLESKQSKKVVEGEGFVMYSSQPINHDVCKCGVCSCNKRTTNALIPCEEKERHAK